MTILDKIIENKRREVNLFAALTPVKDLEKGRFFLS